MALTAQNVIDAAVERSALNDADLISDSELRRYITLAERRAFIEAAKVNPDFFGVEGTTASRSSGGSWDLSTNPGLVAAVARAEINSFTGSMSGLSTGDKVNLISIREPRSAISPRAYIRNKTIYEYDGELSTDASNFVDQLKIFYSKLSAEVTSNGQSLELPDEWGDLVILPLARILAIRDRRADDAQAIVQEFQLVRQNFLDQVGSFSHGAIRSPSAIVADGPAPQVGGNQGG